MIVVDPAHVYVLADEQSLHFIKRTDGELVHDGTTNEELLEVLIDRTDALNAKVQCKENEMALVHMRAALKWFERRTQLRLQQGVETTDLPHESIDVAGEHADTIRSSMPPATDGADD
jgi:hypothetical protein